MDRLSGVGGWLAVFRVFCLLAGFFYLFSVVEWALIPPAEWESLAGLAPAIVPFRFFSRVQAGIVAAGLFGTFYLLVRPGPTTALWALLTLTVMVILDTAIVVSQELFIASFAAGTRARGEVFVAGDFTTSRVHAILGVAVGVTWILYFLKSRRVENTWGPQSFRALAGWVFGK